MADPLSLAEVYNLLPIASVTWDIQRNDEFSGVGSGDVWQAELADPFWFAEITLGRGLHDELKQAAAAIRDLEGAKQSFMCCDPLSPFPQADPNGDILGAAVITIRAVSANRRQALLQGFPAGYQLTRGDKLQFTQGTLRRFFEVSASAIANAGGQMDLRVFPRLPLGLVAGASINLINPACPVIVAPGSHKPGTGRRSVTDGAALKVMQKLRT
ncbi:MULTISPECIES: hypothetical protein [Agrobacterium]|uniref:Uncharacterized protein n=1 Tax=Agrobacterium salinitolerans TaxID=1183413 RepID=A0ABY3BX67_9HYPH|nr:MULTISPECIES: hypothetical protein [Agrobacterium]TRA97046.1 hypothetical protein EXN23_02085 [Agrobacterium salinitolerans]